MKRNRILALLCMLSLCCMNVVTLAPAQADAANDIHASAKVQTEVASNKKKKKDDKSESKATKKPKATKTPKATKKPKATKTPKPTKEPKATKTPKPTKEPKATKTPKPTKEPKATKTPKPTKEPKATKTPKPTKTPKATKAPGETETPEGTKAPEDVKEPEKTEAPGDSKEPEKTEVPGDSKEPEKTEAPGDSKEPEKTEAPGDSKEPEKTEAPGDSKEPEKTEAPGDSKEPETTETPKPTVTPKPTKAPKLKLKGLKANKPEVAPGKTVKFTLTVENAEKVVWSATRSDGQVGGSGKVKGGSFKWKPKESGVYTVTVNATVGDKTASESCTVIVRTAKLSVEALPAVKYAQQGGEKLKFNINIIGGCAPYTMNVVVKHKGDLIFTSEEVLTKVKCDAVGYGNNRLTVTVTDALGDTAEAKAKILSASNATNTAPPLPKLKEDMTFADKLVAVAKSQQGYRESKENFIIRGDDSVQGWSYYGGWYGAPYDEWCAMFVSYCLVQSGIGAEYMPNNGNCNRWKADLGERYIDDEDTYIPEPGDIIFFHHNRVSKDPNYPNHIGIVTKYDAAKDIVHTVEGNSGKSVRARQYERGNSVIVGYASMRDCMVQYDSVYRDQLGDQLAVNLESFRAKYATENDGEAEQDS